MKRSVVTLPLDPDEYGERVCRGPSIYAVPSKSGGADANNHKRSERSECRLECNNAVTDKDADLVEWAAYVLTMAK